MSFEEKIDNEFSRLKLLSNKYFSKFDSKLFVLFGILLLYLLLVLPHVFEPFMGDETVFIKAANGVINTGKPVFIDDLTRENLYQGLWHPPLYVYLISIPLYFFGDNHLGLRSIAIICQLLSIVLIFFIIHLTVKNNKLFYSGIFTLLYALNPLAIQSSIILDIDGSLLILFTLLFFYLYIRKSNILLLSLSLFLLLCSKFSGAVILILTFLIYLVLNGLFEDGKLRKFKLSNFIELKKFFIVFISVLALFLTLFFIYCNYFGLDFFKPFSHNSSIIGNVFSILSGSFNSIAKSFWSFKLFLYFSIPFLFFLFIYALFLFIKLGIYKRLDIVFFTFLFSIIGLSLFVIAGSSGWNYPKYYVLLLPFMLFSIAAIFSELNFKFSMDEFKIKWVIFFGLMLSVYYFVFVKDPLVPEFLIYADKKYLVMALFKLIKSFLLYIFLPLVMTYLFFIKLEFKNLRNRLLFLMFFLVLFTSIYINIFQISSDYSNHNLYGTRGTKQTLLYLKSLNVPSNTMAVYPHIGYYLSYNDYYDITNFYFNKDFVNFYLVDKKNINYFVILAKDIDRVSFLIDKVFKLDRTIGDYYIYRRF